MLSDEQRAVIREDGRRLGEHLAEEYPMPEDVQARLAVLLRPVAADPPARRSA